MLAAALATFSAQAQSDVGSNSFQAWVSEPRIVDLRAESRTGISLGITDGVWRDTNGVNHTANKISVRQNVKHSQVNYVGQIRTRTITRYTDGRYYLTGLVGRAKYVLFVHALVTNGQTQVSEEKMPGRLCFRLTKKGKLNYAKHIVATGCKNGTSIAA